MNKIITYNGNANDLFSIELIENVQAKCLMSGETKNAEHWGDANDSNTEEHYEFGCFGEIAFFEVYEKRIRIFTPDDIIIGRDPMAGYFSIHSDLETFNTGHYSADISVEFVHHRPRTMASFMACYEAFVLSIYRDALCHYLGQELNIINFYNSLPVERSDQDELPI